MLYVVSVEYQLQITIVAGPEQTNKQTNSMNFIFIVGNKSMTIMLSKLYVAKAHYEINWLIHNTL